MDRRTIGKSEEATPKVLHLNLRRAGEEPRAPINQYGLRTLIALAIPFGLVVLFLGSIGFSNLQKLWDATKVRADAERRAAIQWSYERHLMQEPMSKCSNFSIK